MKVRIFFNSIPSDDQPKPMMPIVLVEQEEVVTRLTLAEAETVARAARILRELQEFTEESDESGS